MGPNILVNGVPMPPSTDIKHLLDVLVSDENRNEAGLLDLRVVRSNLTKFSVSYPYLTGKDLKTLLGSTWLNTQDTKSYKYRLKIPFIDGEYYEDDYYYKLSEFTCVIWNEDPDKRVYSGLTITWTCY